VTVVLAVRCADGVVLGSDSQGTDTSGGNIAFATRSTVAKLFPLGTHIAWGATGGTGITQRFAHFSQGVDQQLLDHPIEDLRATLRGFQSQLQRQVQQEIIPGFQEVPLLGVLFAGFTAGRPWILEVTPGGEDTEYTDSYAVGSGGVFAKQAMASVAHYDLPNRNLSEAQAIVWRALDACIEAAAWGLGSPIWLYSVTADGAASLPEDEWRAVEDTVNTWKEAEKDSLIGLGLGVPLQEQPAADDEGLEPPAAPEQPQQQDQGEAPQA
jgi:proteasome beta subunit